MGYSGIMVGYGPEFDDSTGLSQIRHKIDEKFIWEGIYDPERVPKGEQSRQVEITLPNRIHESLICGSDTSTDAFGACPGYNWIFFKISFDGNVYLFCTCHKIKFHNS